MSAGRLGGAPRNLCLSLCPRRNAPLPTSPRRNAPLPTSPRWGEELLLPPAGGGWEGGTALATGPAAPDDIYMSHSRPNGRSS